MIRRSLVALALLVGVAACGAGEDLGSTQTTQDGGEERSLPRCGETPYPSAPDDWYRDTPIYVGNEMPVEEVKAFASGLDGFENIWIDRDHNGWVSVGFHGSDLDAQQAALVAEFPEVGVVAVEMAYPLEELEKMRAAIHDQLPDDMHALNVYEVPGEIEVWAGLLTPERRGLVESVAGDAPVCISGLDPETAPSQGPQAESGGKWVFLAVVDSMLAEHPDVAATEVALQNAAAKLGIEKVLPIVDFDSHIVLALPLIYSGSCPDTRFDGFDIVDDLVRPVIVHTNLAEACTDDANPRTYLIALERDALPEPPFRIWEGERWPQGVTVSSDLRPPASTVEPGDIEVLEFEEERVPTEMPYIIEIGFPWPMIVDVECGLDYLGSINDVGWYREDGETSIPPEWEAEVVEGLLDLDVLMSEGPEPTLTASSGGESILYLPGPDVGGPCE